MKRKLWIAWGILGVTALLSLGLNASPIISYGLAFVSAGMGWICFLKYY